MDSFIQIEKNILLKFAEEIRRLQRQGKEIDAPEGSRYVVISDTLMTQFYNTLMELVENGSANIPGSLR